MAACESLQRIFKKALPGNPTLLESLSPWNQTKSPKPFEGSSCTEIFGELHFKENRESPLPLSSSSSSPSSSSSQIYQNPQPSFANNEKEKTYNSDYFHRNEYVACHKNSDSFSSMNSESLQLCTESLGFESSDEVEELNDEMGFDWQNKMSIARNYTTGELRRSKSMGRTFPPPISSIGKNGRPWVCFKSYRNDGRFVLKEIRMPTQEFLHAKREDGRLKLQLCMSDEEVFEDDDDDDDDDDEENVGDGDCDNDIDVICRKERETGDEKNVKENNNGDC